jgi:hypothetical protein
MGDDGLGVVIWEKSFKGCKRGKREKDEKS